MTEENKHNENKQPQLHDKKPHESFKQKLGVKLESIGDAAGEALGEAMDSR
jgi:hypothetical protein